MLSEVMRAAFGLGLLFWVACKDPELAAAQARRQAADQALASGRAALAAQQFEEAIAAFKTASTNAPEDPTAYIFLAGAERQVGNDGAAILALKQAAELAKASSPVIQRQLADLYRRDGHLQEAVAVLASLRDRHEATDPDILTLARLQGQQGQFNAAFQTLKVIQLKRPDDPAAKVVEAELLLTSGDELLAAKLMDRLINESGIPSARILRARYFLNQGFPEAALQDLDALDPAAAEDPDGIELRARALNDLKRHDQAEQALRQLLARDPKSPDLLAELAETRLDQGQLPDAEHLVDQALALRPHFARALYGRGRVLEAQGELQKAAESYELALKSEPGFGPALSRIWRIYQHRGQKTEAMEALERLVLMNQAGLEEKVALAEMYAETRAHVELGKKLIDEALRHDPDNSHYREIRTALNRLMADGSGVEIIRGKR